MPFIDSDVKHLTEEFWHRLGESVSFPHDIEASAQQVVPISVEKLPGLNIGLINSWLTQRGIPLPNSVSGEQRAIFGCLLAHKGRGIIFVDASATESEQRFTTAHELAHFLRDYQKPRQIALAKMGTNIIAVLDGERTPTGTERVEALLSNVPIGMYSDLMMRGPNNQYLSLHTTEIEKKADYIALELLAPYRRVLEIAGIRPGSIERETVLTTINPLLLSYFDLPISVAAAYATRVASHAARKPTVREWLDI